MAKEQLIVELIAETKDAVKNLKQYTKEAKNSAQKVGALTKIVKSYFAEITAGIIVARKLIKIIGSLAKEFIQFEQVNMAFESMATTAGASSEAILESMRELSGGTISAMEMITSANKAMILGIPIDDLDEMMQIARASAAATGSSVKKMFDDIVIGVGRQSRMILDNLGIIVDVEKANKDYAKSMGIVGRELTDTERRQAFLNATLEAGKDIIEKVGKAGQEATDAERWQQMTASVADLRVELGRTIARAITPMLPLAVQMITNLRLWIEETNNLKDAKLRLKKAQEGVIQLTQLEILQAEQLIEIARLRQIENQRVAAGNEIIFDSVMQVATGILEEEEALRISIRARAQLLDNLKTAIRLRDEEKEIIEDTIPPLKDLTELVIMWSDQMALAGLDAGFFTAALRELEAQTDDNEESIAQAATSIDNMRKAAIDYRREIKNDVIPTAKDFEKAIDEIVASMENLNQSTRDAWAAFKSFGQFVKSVWKKDVLGALLSVIDMILNLTGSIDQARLAWEQAREEFTTDISGSLEQSFTTGIVSAIKDIIAGGSAELKKWLDEQAELGITFSDLEIEQMALEEMKEAITGSIKEGIINAFIQAMIQKTIIEGMMQFYIDQLTHALLLGDQNLIDQALDQMKAMLPSVLAQAEAIANIVGSIASGFQQGGQVQRLQTGGFGDKHPAMLEQGEVVLNKFTVQQNAPAIGAMRSGEGNPQTLNLVIDGNVLAKWMYRQSTNKNLTLHQKAIVS